MSDVFWAAFGGGAAAGIVTLLVVVTAEWLRWYVDRPLLRVSARLGQIATPGMAGGVEMSGKLLFLEATNPHTRQVTVSSFGLSFKRKDLGLLWISPQHQYPLPYQIDGGKSLSQWTPVSGLLKGRREKGQRPDDLRWVWFRTQTGKEYRERIDPQVIRVLQQDFDAETDAQT